MRSTIYAFAAAATLVSAQGTLPLGANCGGDQQCANGASCYASMGQSLQCGKFNAPCQSNSQCATNTCEKGLCSGYLASSLYLAATSTSATTSSATGGIISAPSSTVVAEKGTLLLGAECAYTEQCANGAECFASTAWQIKSCGKFNAACQTNDQCATNTCNNGLCNGFLASSAYLANAAATASSTSSASTVIPSAAVPSSTQATGEGTLALGVQCASSSQCANGASCYASTSGQYKYCGNFNAECKNNTQCAYNTCEKGLCSGFLPSSLYLAPVSTAAPSTLASSVATATGNGAGVTANSTGSATPSPSVYTGAASQAGIGAGVAVAALGFAFALVL